MMRKIKETVNAISIVSWVLTLTLMGIIWYLTLNDVSFRWAWNDVSRCYDSVSIIGDLHSVIVKLIVVAGSTNLISTVIDSFLDRKVEDETEEFVEEEEAQV